MATGSTTASTAAAVDVVLLQPTKVGGKARAAGSTVRVSAAQAESLVQSGCACAPCTEPTEPASDDPAPMVKPRRSTAKQAGPATAAD